MIFNSLEFGVFFLAVLLVYWAVPHRAQNRLLLAASYFFYGWWDWRFLGLLVFSTVVDYLVGRRMEAADDGPGRQRLLAVSIVANLGVLGLFKYFGFFADSLDQALEGVGLSPLAPTVSIVLPVGISFYTFQSMSYTIDVYRRRLAPIDDLLDFALYVSFFPQLVAGPIERATRLLPQITGTRRIPDGGSVAGGLLLILVGLVKKVVIADMAADLVTTTFGRSAEAGGLELLIAVYAFAIQIYGDFSGYSDIARGTAWLLGIELMVNFRQPYLATSITDFWRRWHISLSTWLRDYLYIPLGGNRSGAGRTYRNLMIVMLLGGLWHGPAWTFVAWGLLHGLYLASERYFNLGGPTSLRSVSGVFRLVLTFHLVALAWIFFRADGFDQALEVLGGIVTLRPGPMPLAAFVNVLVALGGLVVALDITQHLRDDETGLRGLHPGLQGLLVGTGLALIVLMSGGEGEPFVYFQF
ncbi:MAG: MBOAT family protein [Actinomycetota bacterium]